MGDWGHLSFHYDYTISKRLFSDEPIRNRGLISNSYKWIGVPGMIMHLANGIEYFLDNKDEFACYAGDTASNKLIEESYCEQFRRAFDIIFPFRKIDTSIDNVSSSLQSIASGRINQEDFNRYTLGGEGTYGYCYVKYTGDPENGYKLKYAIESGGEIVDVNSYLEKWTSSHIHGENSDNTEDYVRECVSLIENNAELMTENELEELLEYDFYGLIEEKNQKWIDIEKQKLNNQKTYSSEDSIDVLSFNVRTYNILKRIGIRTVGDLLNADIAKLKEYKYMTPECYKEISKVWDEI